MALICASLLFSLGLIPALNEDVPLEPIGRSELAMAFLRFEEALRDHPVSDERLRELNRSFDEATLFFFTGDYGRVAGALNGLALSLQCGGAGTGEEHFASSLKVRMAPRVYTLKQEEGPPGIHISRWFSSSEKRETDYSLRLRFLQPGNGKTTPFSINLDAKALTTGSLDLILDPVTLPLAPGRYRMDIVTSRDFRFLAGYWNVTRNRPDEIREAYQGLLGRIVPAEPELAEACVICRARIGLLDDRSRNFDTTPLFVDVHTLRKAVRNELQSLLQGRDPYAGKKGNYWRVLKRVRTEVPMRIHAPSAEGAHGPMPLVIAFHGAGGDENLFTHGYGSGRILELAEEHGFLLAMPRTYDFMRDPRLLESLITSMSRHYDIDPGRIYVLGHSLGAATAALMARRFPERVTAACCLAGGGAFSQSERTAPVLVISAELDPISPLARMEKEVQKGIQSGLPLEFHVKKDHGHTLMVAACLEDSLEWLLKKSRTD